MILIDGAQADTLPAVEGFAPNALQQDMFDTMRNSPETYSYDSDDQLAFELRLRYATVKAARDLARSGLEFRVFRESKANPEFWQRTDEGGFRLQMGARPSEAIRDIYEHGSMYGTECSTAMIIVYYKAMLDVLPEELFDRLYAGIYLMNWQYLDRDLAIKDYNKTADELPGDARYFLNPDVDPLMPEWQGENVFYLGSGRYYGHGIGVADAASIIRALNSARKEGAVKSAYLLDSAKRQDYGKLRRVY
jgi:protein-glutamine gamma-glutamyltransferase